MGINLQQLLDAALAEHDAGRQAEIDAQTAAKIKAALDADAIEDEKVLRAKDDTIAQKDADIAALNARIKELEAGAPTTPNPPAPDPEPPAPTAPSVVAFKALQTDAARKAYNDAAEAWFKANTGPKGALTPYTGPTTITKAGTVIDGKIIKSSLTVAANNVTIKNSQIDYTGMYGINGYGYSGLTVEDTKITGPGMAGTSVAGIFAGDDLKVRRCDISGAEHGIHTQASGIVELNYIHHQRRGGRDPHYDCVICQGWQAGVTIRDNFLITHNTSAVLGKTDFGPVKDVKIQRNWIKNDPEIAPDRWAYYQIYSIEGNYGGVPTGTEITDNVVQKGAEGKFYWSLQGSVKLSGNVDFITGKPAT